MKNIDLLKEFFKNKPIQLSMVDSLDNMNTREEYHQSIQEHFKKFFGGKVEHVAKLISAGYGNVISFYKNINELK